MGKDYRNMPSYIRHFVDQSNTKIRPFVVSGNFNTEYIRGNQNIKIGENLIIKAKQYEDAKVYTERKIFNRMNPIYLTRYAILTDNMPIPGFKPSTSSHKSVIDANKGNSFITEFMQDIDFKAKHCKIITRGDTYAAVWVKTGVDWSEGEDVATIEVDVNGEKKEFLLKEGRPFIQPIPLHEIAVDNLFVDSIDEVQELAHRKPYSLDYIKKRWGYDAKSEEITDVMGTELPGQRGVNNPSDMKYAFVYEYYKRADIEYPEGRHIIMVNDKILYDQKLPYENGFNGKRNIPFDIVNLQTVPGHIFGMSVYPQLIPIQDTLNAVKNRYLEYVNHIAIGQLYYWEGSLLNKSTFSTKPGKLIGLKRNARPPQAVQKTQLTNEFISYLRMLDEDMLITAGLSPLTVYGTGKSNMRTDGLVDKVAESDQNKLVNAIDNISNAYIQIFKKILYLEKFRQKFIKEKLGLAKKDAYVVKYNLEEVDVEQLTIVNREFLMQSDQIYDKKLQQANQLGLYNAQMNLSYISKKEMLNAIKANYLKDTLDPKERANHELIETEHFMILESKKADVEQFHNHEQHIYEHDLFRLSPELLVLKDKDPKKYDLILQSLNEHIQTHQKFVQKNQGQNVYDGAKAFMKSTAQGDPRAKA
jgi:hypothetical protein